MSSESTPAPGESPDRRDFVKKVVAGGIGGVLVLPPLAAGITVWTDPLRRGGTGGQQIRVTSLSALPEDGVPRKFPVVGSRVDAWTHTAARPIGAVYLRREPGKPVQAFNVVCPHAGCFVDYSAAGAGPGRFVCPCHDSSFALDGRISDPHSPAPRGLDALEVEVRDGDVWVKFQNFRAGVTEKIPV